MNIDTLLNMRASDQEARDAIAYLGCPGSAQFQHRLGIVGPEIRMVFLPTGNVPVDILLTGNQGVGRTADPNLDAWMETDNEFAVQWQRYRFELYPFLPAWQTPPDDVWSVVAQCSALFHEFAPSGGKVPYYYPGAPYLTVAGASVDRENMDTATPGINVRTPADAQWFDNGTYQRCDFARDTWRIRTGQIAWPANGDDQPYFGFHLVLRRAFATPRRYLENTEPPLEAMAGIYAAAEAYGVDVDWIVRNYIAARTGGV